MSQSPKVLERLRQESGDWVSMLTLVGASNSFNIHSRIAELRGDGHTIKNKIEPQPDGSKRSWYRLLETEVVR